MSIDHICTDLYVGPDDNNKFQNFTESVWNVNRNVLKLLTSELPEFTQTFAPRVYQKIN